MYPVLFRIFNIPVYSYGLMMGIAFLVCIALILTKAKAAGLPYTSIFDLCFYILVSGIIGARILYILINIKYYIEHPIEIFLLQKGGLSYYGGFITALAAGVIFTLKRKLPIAKISDLIVLYLPLGHAIARIGCYLNGCCYGKITKIIWAVQFPEGSLAECHFGPGHFIHPVQLYSVLMNLMVFIILNLKRKCFDGELIFDYMIFYGLGRFVIECFRADNAIVLFGLTIFQIMSLLMIVFGFILRFIIRKYARRYL